MLNLVGLIFVVLLIIAGIKLWNYERYELDDYFPSSGGQWTNPYRWLSVTCFVIAVIIIIILAARFDGYLG